MDYKKIFKLEKKNTLVFGSEGKLGREIVKCFQSHGAKVICADIRNLKKKNYYKCNTSKEADIKKLILNLSKIKINNIVFCITSKKENFYMPFEKSGNENFIHLVETELYSSYLIAKNFHKILKKTKGNLIFVSSIYGLIANDPELYKNSGLDKVYSKSMGKEIFPNPSYNIVKGGIISFTKYLSAKWGKDKVRVNCVSPGGVFDKSESKIFNKKYSKSVPIGRKAYPTEIPGTVLFLASEASSYITGQNIIIDGGKTII